MPLSRLYCLRHALQRLCSYFRWSTGTPHKYPDLLPDAGVGLQLFEAFLEQLRHHPGEELKTSLSALCWAWQDEVFTMTALRRILDRDHPGHGLPPTASHRDVRLYLLFPDYPPRRRQQLREPAVTKGGFWSAAITKRSRLRVFNEVQKLPDRAGPAVVLPQGLRLVTPDTVRFSKDLQPGLCIIPALEFCIGQELDNDLREHVVSKNSDECRGIGMSVVVDWIMQRPEITTRFERLRSRSFLYLLERVQGAYVFCGRVKDSLVPHWFGFNAWKGVVYVGCKAGVVVLENEENVALQERRAKAMVDDIRQAIGLDFITAIYAVCEKVV